MQCVLLSGGGAVFGGGVHLAGTEGLGADSRPAWARRGWAAGSAGCNRRPTASSCCARKTSFPPRPTGRCSASRPYVSFCATFCAFLALPFANGWVALELDIGVFFILAVAGLEVFGVILGGYASGSKWSLYGAMREAAQMVSYEIPLGPVRGRARADRRHDEPGGDRQRARPAGSTNWYVFHDPFTFVTFWVYVTCAVASTNRAPFDLPEAESELVAGFLTEYSGFRWVIFFMAEYAAMFVVSGLGSLLFLGRLERPDPDRHAGWGSAAIRTPWPAGSATCWACAISSPRPCSA